MRSRIILGSVIALLAGLMVCAPASGQLSLMGIEVAGQGQSPTPPGNQLLQAISTVEDARNSAGAAMYLRMAEDCLRRYEQEYRRLEKLGRPLQGGLLIGRSVPLRMGATRYARTPFIYDNWAFYGSNTMDRRRVSTGQPMPVLLAEQGLCGVCLETAWY